MRIGEVADQSGLTTKALRFYEQIGLLPEPPRTAGGYRDYPSDIIDRLAFIRAAQATGLTLADIRGVLAIRDAGQAPCHHVSELIGRHLAEAEIRLQELDKVHAALTRLKRRAVATDSAECGAEGVCSIIT